MRLFEHLLEENELALPLGIVSKSTQRLGADGATQLVITIGFATKEDAEAALDLDAGHGISSPAFHAYLESTDGSRRGQYLLHGPALIGLNHEQLQRLLCRLPRVSAVKVEPAYLYDDGVIRADAFVATITHTGSLPRCFTVPGFQQAVWLDRKVPRMPIIEPPPAGSAQPLPVRHLPTSAQWAAAALRPQQKQREQRQQGQPIGERQRDPQAVDQQQPVGPGSQQEQQQQQQQQHQQPPRQEQQQVDMDVVAVLSPAVPAAGDLPRRQDGSRAASTSPAGSSGPAPMDFTRGQPKRPTILAPAAVDEAPAKAARASTSSLPLPASPEDTAPQGRASTQVLLPKEEADFLAVQLLRRQLACAFLVRF